MTLAQYGIYSLVGICVVFFALALLMGIVKIIQVVPFLADAPAKTPAAGAASVASAPAAPAAPVEPVYAPGSAGELNLYDTDPRDAAMIMAIVADELGKPLNELRFLSIKEVKR